MAPKPKLIVVHPVHGYKIKPAQDLKTMKRNARERNRVQTVNSGFERIRQLVPSAAADTKMSKVNILGHAVDYIQCLHSILQQCNNTQFNQNMTHQITPNYAHEQASPSYLSQQTSPNFLPHQNGARIGIHSEYYNQMNSPTNGSDMYNTHQGYISPVTPPCTDSNSFSMTPGSVNYNDSGIYSPKSCYQAPTLSSSSTSTFSPSTPFTPESPFSPAPSTGIRNGSTEYSSYNTTHFSFQGYDRTCVRKARESVSEDDDLLDAIADWQTGSGHNNLC